MLALAGSDDFCLPKNGMGGLLLAWGVIWPPDLAEIEELEREMPVGIAEWPAIGSLLASLNNS